MKNKLAIELSERLQERFYRLQNPSDCNNNNTLLCDINFAGCGFGCQIHHIIYCFNEAVNLNRTFILDSSNWTYHTEGFEAYFRPLSDVCKYSKEKNGMTHPMAKISTSGAKWLDRKS
jgi:glycoprotein 6-alpha-L-fucosyltransferase